ncbi:hypothetical protein LguiA_001441 [Lonicera macranthoides]
MTLIVFQAYEIGKHRPQCRKENSTRIRARSYSGWCTEAGRSIVPINAQCLEDQRSLLLQLKNTVKFDSSFSTKLVQWNHHNKDCCLWEGITRSKAGHVTGLDLNDQSISGGIDNSSSLFNLWFLQSLNLAYNNFNFAQIPSTFINLTSLTYLNLSYSDFGGQIPIELSQLTSNTNVSGQLPNSIANLTQLAYLDLSTDMFTGAVPSLQMSKNLTHIDLSNNNLSGPFSFTQFEGRIPSSLFGLPSLKKFLLSNNHFDGSLPEIPNTSNSMLDTLELQGNKLEGEIPSSFFDLKSLNILTLSSNNLNGTIQLQNVQKLVNLTTLDLSYNNLSIETGGNHSGLHPFPQITTLKLASCKLRNFPDLKDQTEMSDLDLSDNQIGGEIPNWIWKVGNGSLKYLNLSLNFLKNLQEPYVIPSLYFLDLHSIHLRGKLPLPPDTALYVDYSSNYFGSSTPVSIDNNILSAYSFYVANNNLTRTIPIFICNARNLNALDMSKNSLSGPIPLCLIVWTETIGTLNLGKNRLSGNLSGIFQENCRLETLDLHDNQLKGKIPESISNCSL